MINGLVNNGLCQTCQIHQNHFLNFPQLFSTFLNLSQIFMQNSHSLPSSSLHMNHAQFKILSGDRSTYVCYHWSPEDRAAITALGSSVDAERSVCEGLGHVFTQGFDCYCATSLGLWHRNHVFSLRRCKSRSWLWRLFLLSRSRSDDYLTFPLFLLQQCFILWTMLKKTNDLI